MHSSPFSGLSSVAQTYRFGLGIKLRQGLRKSAQLLLLPFVIGALQQSVQAQSSASTDIVGFVSVTALGDSDTRFSAPLHRPTAYQGVVSSVSGNVITVQGSPAWSTSPQQWQYLMGSQTNTYYVEFGSGAKEGLYYTIVSNGSNALTIDLAGDTLEGAVISGDSIRIIPYWTLGTLFPNQAGVTGTTNIGGSGSMTRIFLPDVITGGVDLAASSSYYYYTGTGFGGAGWRRQGGGLSNIKNDDVIPPDLFVIFRQDGVASTVIQVASGAVPITTSGGTDRRYIIGTVTANVPQDNAVALGVPVPLTLSQLNLFQSGAFTGTTNAGGSTGDKLYVFDDSVAGINKAASSSYYYYTGTGFGGPGWRKQAGGLNVIRDSEVVFQPGTGIIIRKEASPVPSTVVWSIPLSY